MVRRTPGLRVPGAFDGFETAVRAILGQQITVRGATTLTGRFAQRYGKPLRTPHSALTHVFPSRGDVRDDVASIGIPRARAHALLCLARSKISLEPGTTSLDALRALPGIGEWTAQYLAMRALSWPDAFPASDLGVLKAMRAKTAKEATAHAEVLRPWRSYAVLHLWTHGGRT